MTRIEAISKAVASFQTALNQFPEFRYVGDQTLRQKTERVSVSEGTEIGKTLGKILARYRELVGYGRGLAAPQIGISKSVFVTFLEGEVQVYINPLITASSVKQNFYRELCLSSGIIWGDIRRAESITMQWTNPQCNLSTQEFDGVLARLLQHEYRHLEGQLNIDIAEPGSLEIVTDDPLKERLRDQPLRQPNFSLPPNKVKS